MNAPDNPTENREFEARTKQVFDESVDQLDARTRSRLTQARHAAAAQLQIRNGAPTGYWTRNYWMPAAGLVAAAVFVLVVMMPRMAVREPAAAATLADDDMPLLLDSDSVEMLEDMEFYAWLDDAALDAETTDDTGGRPVDPARS